MSDRSPLVIAGAVIMAMAFVFPALVWSASGGNWEDAIGAIILTFVFAPLAFLGGLVLLIVGLVRGGRARQQQQQQVIVLPAGAAVVGGAPGVAGARFCTGCGGALSGVERFCTHCGAPLGA